MRLKHRAIRALWAGLAATCLVAAASAAASAAARGPVNQPAPDFALPSLSGENVRLSEYRGQPVVVSFWSSRCSVCARQLAALNEIYATYRSSGLIVLAVSVDDDSQRAQDYARAHAKGFPMLMDQAKSVSRAYGIDQLPTTVLIDRSGVVRYLHADYRANDASYIVQIRALLNDSAGGP